LNKELWIWTHSLSNLLFLGSLQCLVNPRKLIKPLAPKLIQFIVKASHSQCKLLSIPLPVDSTPTIHHLGLHQKAWRSTCSLLNGEDFTPMKVCHLSLSQWRGFAPIRKWHLWHSHLRGFLESFSYKYKSFVYVFGTWNY